MVAMPVFGQVERDTVEYEIIPQHIDEINVIGDAHDIYWVRVLLKEIYHDNYADLTEDNIENVLRITFQNEVLAQPVIKSGVRGGRILIGPYEDEEKARGILNWIRDGI